MITLSLLANILALAPVLWLIARDASLVRALLGPDSVARRVLGAVYAGIFVISLFLLWRHLAGDAHAQAWVQALLALQVVYKLIALAAVGPRSLVVQGNLLLAALHACTLLTL